MKDEQFNQLIDVLKDLASGQTYTITGAADWPILAALCAILCALLAFMWRDLRSIIKTHREESKEDVKQVKQDSSVEIERVWKALKDCQTECCPRNRKD